MYIYIYKRYKGAVKEVALEEMKNLSPASLAPAPSSTGVTQLDGVKVCACMCESE